MTLTLLALWVLSFFFSFLLAQHADRNAGLESTKNTVSNLVLSSVPGANLIMAIGWWLITKTENK